MKLKVSLDGNLYHTYTITVDEELQKIEIPIENIKQLRFDYETTGEYHGYPYIGIGYPAVY